LPTFSGKQRLRRVAFEAIARFRVFPPARVADGRRDFCPRRNSARSPRCSPRRSVRLRRAPSGCSPGRPRPGTDDPDPEPPRGCSRPYEARSCSALGLLRRDLADRSHRSSNTGRRWIAARAAESYSQTFLTKIAAPCAALPRWVSPRFPNATAERNHRGRPSVSGRPRPLNSDRGRCLTASEIQSNRGVTQTCGRTPPL
jgi:hypothetical protein